MVKHNLFSLFLLIIFSCNNKKENYKIKIEGKPFIAQTIEFSKDSLENYFQTKGVLSFIANDNNLKKDFEILNLDNTLFAKFNFLKQDFINTIKKNPDFNPIEFYPENYILQFEYVQISNNYAIIYLDKSKKNKKMIKVNSLFKLESWREHFIGGIIGFNDKTNPVKKTPTNNSEVVGFDSKKSDQTFKINSISGDWLKIECAEICEIPCSSGSKYNGWIKWKLDNKLLIRFLFSC